MTQQVTEPMPLQVKRRMMALEPNSFTCSNSMSFPPGPSPFSRCDDYSVEALLVVSLKKVRLGRLETRLFDRPGLTFAQAEAEDFVGWDFESYASWDGYNFTTEATAWSEILTLQAKCAQLLTAVQGRPSQVPPPYRGWYFHHPRKVCHG